jgi:hypothetical protein
MLDRGFNRVSDFARTSQFLVMAALDSGGIREAPMQPRCDAGINWATFGAGFVANGNDVGEGSAGFVHIKYRFGVIAGNIYADFLHGFDDDRVEFPWLNTRTVGFELCAADLIEEGLGHLASGAVVDADKQDLLLHSFGRKLARLGRSATAVFFTHATAGWHGEAGAEDGREDVQPEVFGVE